MALFDDIKQLINELREYAGAANTNDLTDALDAITTAIDTSKLDDALGVLDALICSDNLPVVIKQTLEKLREQVRVFILMRSVLNDALYQLELDDADALLEYETNEFVRRINSVINAALEEMILDLSEGPRP